MLDYLTLNHLSLKQLTFYVRVLDKYTEKSFHKFFKCFLVSLGFLLLGLLNSSVTLPQQYKPIQQTLGIGLVLTGVFVFIPIILFISINLVQTLFELKRNKLIRFKNKVSLQPTSSEKLKQQSRAEAKHHFSNCKKWLNNWI